MEYITPCRSCIHFDVCGAKSYVEETKVEIKTTHPFFEVNIKCIHFEEKGKYTIKRDKLIR